MLAWALARWWNISPLQQLHADATALLWGVVATLPLLLSLRAMLRTTIGPIRQLVSLVVDQIGPLLTKQTLFQLGLLAAVAGFSEEVLFRGVIQVGLTRWMSPGWAVVSTAFLFGLVHFASRTYAVLAGIMGLYLGVLFLMQGSLLAPIVAHGLYDFVALVSVTRRYRLSAAHSPTSAG